jgi:Arc/MetJ family transcription regulator
MSCLARPVVGRPTRRTGPHPNSEATAKAHPRLSMTVQWNAAWGKAEESCLTCMSPGCIFMHMRTTLNIDDSLLRTAARLAGVEEKTALVRLGLEALIARESARRLAELGGTEKSLLPIRRRRPRKAA